MVEAPIDATTLCLAFFVVSLSLPPVYLRRFEFV